MNTFSEELAKAATPELTKTTGNFIQRLFGPVADEAGLMLAESVRLRRFEASIKTAERARKMLEDAHLEPQSVPLKTLVPLLEGASVEEDEALQEKWSALLANSAALEGKVLPSFVEVLRQLSPAEAKLLDAVAQQSFYEPGGFQTISIPATDPALKNFKTEEIEVLVSSLARNDLMTYVGDPTSGPEYLIAEGPDFTVTLADVRFEIFPTPFGRAFMKACRAPKSASD